MNVECKGTLSRERNGCLSGCRHILSSQLCQCDDASDTNLIPYCALHCFDSFPRSSCFHHHKVRTTSFADHGTSPLLLLLCFISSILVISSAYMPTLTQTAGLKIAPLFLQSLVKHYYGKVVKDPSSSRVSLRDEELLYDQVFSVVKVCVVRVVSSQRSHPCSR